MDETVSKISLAAFLHDIGKFADKQAMGISDEFLNRHADLYQPSFKGQYSHAHAVYTAAFIENLSKFLPPECTQPTWGEGDVFINLAASHHKPETPLQWIIALADRISSGWDRETFDQEYNYQIPWKNYKKTRLVPIFEQMRLESDRARPSREGFIHHYPLRSLSSQTIFPSSRLEHSEDSSTETQEEYSILFKEFQQKLGGLYHRRENLHLWCEHFDSLMMHYVSAMPAARAGRVIPDVSLYDHCRTTSALAVAIYLYHKTQESLMIKSIDNWDEKKFLIISGDFYGIQNFIFSDAGNTRRYRSKILRGRSFAVSLFSELAADMLCREIGLPLFSVLFNAAGKFKIMASNTQKAKEAIAQVETQLNDWLMKVSYGENAIGISYLEASANDFVSGRFSRLWDQLSLQEETKKLARLNLEKYSGPIHSYLDSFNNELTHPLCPFCGKRPSDAAVETERTFVKDVGSACTVCRDHIFLGTNLVKKKRLAVIRAETTPLKKENSLLSPIFDYYQVSFVDDGQDELAKNGHLLKLWDLTIDPAGGMTQHVAVKYLNGYVPTYTKEVAADERITQGLNAEEKISLWEQIDRGEPKTLEHIAAMALRPTDNPDKYLGIAALGILKADIDHLGLLLAAGLEEKSFTISRLSTLSRQLNFYFGLYLPHLFSTESKYRQIYTVFAGGDDLFLIGPWNCIIELAVHLQESFEAYVCHNPEITLSAGISLQKPHTPLDYLAAAAEAALKESKDRGRNRLTLFDETVTWPEMAELLKIRETLQLWLEQHWINNAMLYRLHELMVMAAAEKRLVKNNTIQVQDLSCVKWRALLAYAVERNAAKDLKGERRQETVRAVGSQMAAWLLQYGSKLKIPLWGLLYDLR